MTRVKLEVAASLLLIIVGGIVAATGFSTPMYSNESAYEEAYQAIDPSTEGTTAANQKFVGLRERYVTNRFALVDYGLTALIVGFILLALTKFRLKNLTAPKTRLRFFLWALVAAGTFSVADIAQVIIDLERGHYPHWADSAAIGFAAGGVLGILLVAFFSVHLFFIRSKEHLNALLFPLNLRGNYWLTLMMGLSTIALAFTIYGAGYLQVITMTIWVYFFTSLMSTWRDTKGVGNG